MYARVAKWEGADGEKLRQAAREINAEAPSGPPEGLPAKGFMMLIDPDNGRSLAVVLFETEEDLRKGDEILNGMTPRVDDGSTRTSVEHYEVGVDVRV
ncbi:MAG TPA: hypothetical protein VE972_08025 [Conexibacter sp.]|nr:hypothetical protein [Conexibacter sp.]